MSTLRTWHELSAGGTDAVVLAADFDVPGRTEARFGELVPFLEPAPTLWVTDVSAVASAPGDSAEPYVKQWVDEVHARGQRVEAVLGFCGSATYAAALAEALERRQGEFPPTVLFDPERPTALAMFFQFRKALDMLSPAVPPAQLTIAETDAQRAQHGSADLGEFATRLLEIYQPLAGAAFDRLGLDGQRRAELLATVRVFLAFMAAAEQLDPDAAWRRATVLSSATPTSGLNGLRSLNRSAAADAFARELRFDVPHVDLLRSATVGRAVSSLITGDVPDPA